ncbi:DUF6221 family protein [Streptomyces anthocyanicus]|uniref:DUF6221 family protein n=1 Tax=Streptomyces anthocyanicus TaxID=68174 RepID=UPI00386CF6A7|nr:DUF6221 family protein [Streptomyces anthocyanicus]
MDLHAWITQQVDETERIARNHQQPSPRWEYDHFVHEIRDLHNAGTVANVYLDGTAAHIEHNDPAAILRRCEADRRILAIHYAVEDGYFTACDGCGTAGICDDWVTENINDCPILLALAHAHGITDEILASLDRPTPPEPQPGDSRRLGLGDILATPPITTSQVPAALRGPRWKP